MKDLGNPAVVNLQRARRGEPPDPSARPFGELLSTRDVRAALVALRRLARGDENFDGGGEDVSLTRRRPRVAVMCAEETWVRDAEFASRRRAPPAPRGKGGACHRYHIAEVGRDEDCIAS